MANLLVMLVPCLLLLTIHAADGLESCCGDLGCFSSGGDFFDILRRPVPAVPVCALTNDKQLKLRLTTRRNLEETQILDPYNTATIRASNFDPKQKTKILIHGWLDKWNRPVWQSIASELLKDGNHNVIRLDWAEGNWFPYVQAVGNLRLVGAYAARFIQHLVSHYSVDPADIHVIGHSLGSHGAGYAGSDSQSKYNITVGRITGLDPAGPLFTNMPTSVRLDPTDAAIVDTVVTNGDVLLAMGSPQAMGALNFWPNGGVVQPGCSRSLIATMLPNGLTRLANFTLPGGILFDPQNPFDLVAAIFSLQYPLSLKSNLVRNAVLDLIDHTGCSHVRALTLFRDAISNSSCIPKSRRCDNFDLFTQPESECAHCIQDGVVSCSPFGLRANLSLFTKNRQKNYYTVTTSKSPFCSQLRVQFTIQTTAASGVSAREATQNGNVFVTFYGSRGTSPKLLLTPEAITLKAGETYTLFPEFNKDIGTLQSLVFNWRSSGLLVSQLLSRDYIHLQGDILTTDAEGLVSVFTPARSKIQSGQDTGARLVSSHEQ